MSKHAGLLTADDPAVPGDASADEKASDRFRTHMNAFVYSPTNATNSVSKSRLPPRKPKMGPKKDRTIVDMLSKPDASRRSGRKRSSQEQDEDYADPITTTVTKKKKRSSKKERAAADEHNPTSNLVDSLRPNLMLVFIGLNPGLMTAATGHAYAHPSNKFWKLLHWSGVTPERHLPSETHDLMDLYSIGNTNICLRPTRTGDGLSKEELLQGAAVLDEKIATFRPEAVCIVGKSIWESIYKHKTGKQLKAPDFKYGWQDEDLWLGRTLNDNGDLDWAGAKTFVATTTSGLAASMKTEEKVRIWRPLGDWVCEKREGKVKEDKSVKNEAAVKKEDDATKDDGIKKGDAVEDEKVIKEEEE